MAFFNLEGTRLARGGREYAWWFCLDTVFFIFLFAGVFDQATVFNYLPVDLTIFSGVILIILLGTSILLFPKSFTTTRRAAYTAGFLFALILYTGISIFWAPGGEYGSAFLFRLASGGILALSYPIIAVRSSRRRQRQFLWVLGGVCLILTLTIFVYSGTPPWAPHYIAIGRPAGIGAVLGITTAITANERSNSILALSISGLCALGLLVVGSRGPLLSFGITALVIIVISVLNPQYNFQIGDGVGEKNNIMALSGILGLAVVGVMYLIINGILELRTVDRIVNAIINPGRSITERIDLYNNALELWGSSAFSIIAGNGAGSFSVLNSVSSKIAYPHNLLLELLVSTGVIGLILFLGSLFSSVRGALHPTVSSTPVGLAAFGLVLYMFLNAQVTGDLYINRYLFTFMSLLSVISVVRSQQNLTEV